MPLLKPSSGSASSRRGARTPGTDTHPRDHWRTQAVISFGGREAVARDRQAHGEDAGGIEAELDLHHLEEAADEEPAAAEQDEGEGDFDHDEGAAQPASPPSPATTAAFLHRAGEVRPGRLQRRHQSEEDAGHHREAEGERQDPTVHLDADGGGQEEGRQHYFSRSIRP